MVEEKYYTRGKNNKFSKIKIKTMNVRLTRDYVINLGLRIETSKSLS